MKNKKQTIIEWYLMEQEALKEKIFFNKMTTNEFLNEKKRIDLEFNDMFYDHIYEAFESGRQSGYDEAIKEVVDGDTFFGLRDGEEYIKENYG
jgi:hypothetical protein